MATKQKKQNQQKTDKIRLINTPLRTEGDFYVTSIEAMVVGTDGNIKSNCPVNFYDENLELIQTDKKLTGVDGKIVLRDYQIPKTRAGSSVKVRAQIQNSPAEAFVNISIPSPQYSKARILLSQGPINQKDQVRVTIHAKTVDSDGKPIENVRFLVKNEDGQAAELFGQTGNEVISGVNGQSTFIYCPKLKKLGKDVVVYAEAIVHGLCISEKIDLTIPELTGLFSGWSWVKQNWKRPAWKTGVALASLVILYVFLECGGWNPHNNYVIAGLFGIFLWWRKDWTRSGLIRFTIVLVITLISPDLINNIIWRGSLWAFYLGTPSYWLEKLMPRRPDNGKPKFNIFPKWTMAALSLVILWNFFAIATPAFKSYKPADFTSNREYEVVLDQPHEIIVEKHTNVFLWTWSKIPILNHVDIGASFDAIINIFKLIITLLVLTTALPEDIVEMFSKEKTAVGGLDFADLGLMLSHLWSWFIALFRKKRIR